jgi:hypothetical protein
MNKFEKLLKIGTIVKFREDTGVHTCPPVLGMVTQVWSDVWWTVTWANGDISEVDTLDDCWKNLEIVEVL